MNRLFRAASIRGTFSTAPLPRQHQAPGTAGLETERLSAWPLSWGWKAIRRPAASFVETGASGPSLPLSPGFCFLANQQPLGRWSHKDDGGPQDMNV